MTNNTQLNETELLLPEAMGLNNASLRYAELYPLRAAVQAIPCLGGTLDTMFVGPGTNWQAKRLENFLQLLTQRIAALPDFDHLQEIKPSEPLYDFVVTVFEQVVRTRSERKHARFANLVARQVASPIFWDEAETVARLLGELSDSHVDILLTTLNVPACRKTFEGIRVVVIAESNAKSSEVDAVNPTDLREIFPDINPAGLRMFCSDLTAKGLVYDVAVDCIDIRGMTHFVATDLASWFISQINS